MNIMECNLPVDSTDLIMTSDNGFPAAAGGAVETPPGTGDGVAQGAHEVWREGMLLQHLPMVRLLARKIHERLPKHVEMEELVSYGTMGLIDAIDRFDHGRGVQFNSYAQFRIKGAILDALREMDWGSRGIRKSRREMEEAKRNLMHRHGRTPEQEEIAAEMGIPLLQYQHLLSELKGLEVASLNEVRHDGEGDEDVVHVAGPEEESPIFAVMQMEQRQQMIDIIEELPETERLVLTLYYYEELALTEIASILGVVKSRVSQIHTRALARVRAMLGHAPGIRLRGRRARRSAPLQVSAA